MLKSIFTSAADITKEANLRREIADFVQTLRGSAGIGDRKQVARAESAVNADPGSAFTFDPAGIATLTVEGNTWNAGRFGTPSIADLRKLARGEKSETTPSMRLWVIDGASPATDIGSLQGTAEEGTLFQVASQFNCLESPGPFVTPVADYFHDLTQGPRASISVFPATLQRHYAAPGDKTKRFVQTTGGKQLDLLADVFEPGTSPVVNGYLYGHGAMSASALVQALESGFERIRVGLHESAQVVLGYNWDGSVADSGSRLITQVFTSTVAGGWYGGESEFGEQFEPTCRLLQRAAYLGTLLSAAALRRSTVVLTLIGGGVFANPVEIIWKALLSAFDEVQPLLSKSLNVVLNGYNLSRLTTLDSILPDVRARGGVILRFDRDGLLAVLR
jgi:hypothetical protein